MALNTDQLWDPKRRVFLDGLQAANDNAQALLADARLLLEHKRFARAAALSVIGQEEAGKALLYYLIALGRIRREHLAQTLRRIQYNHKIKQAMAVSIRVLGTLVGELRDAVVDATPASLEVSELNRFWDIAGPRMFEAIEGLKDTIDPKTEIDEIYEDGLQQMIKHAGLYVDLNDDGILDPLDTARRDAEVEMRDLKLALIGLAKLVPLATLDDAEMEMICGMVEAQP